MPITLNDDDPSTQASTEAGPLIRFQVGSLDGPTVRLELRRFDSDGTILLAADGALLLLTADQADDVRAALGLLLGAEDL